MISDGLGYNHVEATSFYTWGQADQQVYCGFPVHYGLSTYAAGGAYDPEQAWRGFGYVRQGATDSAAAATAMSTGVKTYAGAVGVDPSH
jgi:alkaline phosphatase